MLNGRAAKCEKVVTWTTRRT